MTQLLGFVRVGHTCCLLEGQPWVIDEDVEPSNTYEQKDEAQPCYRSQNASYTCPLICLRYG